MKQNIFRVFALVALVFVTNCDYKTPVYEYFPNMYDSPARESQEDDSFASNGSASRIPPKGAIPVGYYPYPYATVAAPDLLTGPDKGLKNPIGKVSLGDMMIGEKRFQTYCAPCHGVQGLGNGTVIGPSPKFEGPVPAIVSDNVRGWTDGQIYHIITMGRGRMGSYAYQIEPEDRWKLIAYIRKLQDYEVKNKKAN